MFAIELSKEKRIKKFWAAGFSDLPAINATVFSKKNADGGGRGKGVGVKNCKNLPTS